MGFRYFIYYVPPALLVNMLALYGMEYAGFAVSEIQKKEELKLSVRLWSQSSIWSQNSKASSKKQERPPLLKNPLTSENASQKIRDSKKRDFKSPTLASALEIDISPKDLKHFPLQKQKQSSTKDSSTVKHKAEYVRQIAPVYPRRAWELGQEGTVVLRVRVGSGGFAQRVKVHRSSNFKLLDQAALKAVKEWKFKTKQQNVKRQPLWVKVPIRFLLEDRN